MRFGFTAYCLVFRPHGVSRLPAHRVRLGDGSIPRPFERDLWQSQALLAGKLRTREEPCSRLGPKTWTAVPIPPIEHRPGGVGAKNGPARRNPAWPGLYFPDPGTPYLLV